MSNAARNALGTLVLLCMTGVAGYSAGRHAVPAKVEERVVYKDRVEYRDRVVEKRVEGPVRIQTVTRTVPGPAGPERIVTRIEERAPVVVERQAEARRTAEVAVQAAKVVVNEQPRWLVTGTAGIQLGAPLHPPAYGVQLMYRVAGPAWVGAAADTRGEVRAVLGVSF